MFFFFAVQVMDWQQSTNTLSPDTAVGHSELAFHIQVPYISFVAFLIGGCDYHTISMAYILKCYYRMVVRFSRYELYTQEEQFLGHPQNTKRVAWL